jgi:hypothetical protein
MLSAREIETPARRVRRHSGVLRAFSVKVERFTRTNDVHMSPVERNVSK